jgi:hypothetical protein
MIFHAPSGVSFDIPEDWWAFAEMPDFKPASDYYPYHQCEDDVEIILLSDIEPLRRSPGTPLFEKCRLVPVLFAFQSRFCALPPIELHPNSQGQFRYRLHNGCHRYYASIAAGYSHIPALVFEPFVG